MPSSDDLISDFDDPNAQPPAEIPEDFWGPPSRKNKKKKGRKNGDIQLRAAEEEDTSYSKSITPSPPTDFGVKLDDAVAGREIQQAEELPAAYQTDFEDAATAVEDSPPTPAPIAPPGLSLPKAMAPRPTASPSLQRSRPASLQGPPQQYSDPNSYRNKSSTAVPLYSQPRRESFQSHASPRSHFVEPAAPPHMAQPHFYGLPDLGFGFGQKKEQAGKAAGSDGYCCCFDSFADSGDLASAKKAKDALLVGSECGLEVFRVLPNKFEVVGRLEGLRGSVIGAKILPHTELYDSVQSMRPLVAVVVHGAVRTTSGDDGRPEDAQALPSHYQTTVEVYSLQTQQHVATLYSSILVPIEQPTIGHVSSLPSPVGDLSIDAEGKFIVVASGKSGEIFVFSHATTASVSEPHFRCLGKLWTTLQQPLDGATSRPHSSSDAAQTIDDEDKKSKMPIFSLSQRWLTLIAPSTSSLISIQGTCSLSKQNPNPPGFATHVAPPQPPITCDVVGLDAEGTLGRLTRQTAQGIVKYSQKGIEIGWQGWKEFTNPTSQTSQQHGRTSSKEQDQFPPTNAPAHDPSQVAKEPAVVSIVDLETLLDAEATRAKYPPLPLTTFAVQEGCNFLSLSSNGLRLLTVNRNGAISTVWDLMQANHGTTKVTVTSESEPSLGPCVKQIHRIPRTSQSIVVDCAWSRDDDYLAILTTHGTVHLHEVPSRTPPRKRKRGSSSAVPVLDKAEATVSVSQDMSPPSSNGFLGSIRSSWQQVSTQVNTMRSQNPVAALSFAGFKEATANAGQAGGRALAKGLSQGFTAAKGASSDYWHSEDNKIRHKDLREVGPGSLRWIRRQSGTLLVVVCGGTVHLHPVERIERRKGDLLVSGLKQDKYGVRHFKLPPIRTIDDQTDPQRTKSNDCSQEGPHGFWSLRTAPAVDSRRTNGFDVKSSPSHANEVDTTPPYCPFHVDANVKVFAFDDAVAGSQINLLDEPQDSRFHVLGHGRDDEEPWLFGEPLPASTRMNIHEPLEYNHRGSLDDSDYEEDVAEQMESKLTIHAADDPGGEQIRIDTRRTRHRRAGSEVEALDDDDSLL